VGQALESVGKKLDQGFLAVRVQAGVPGVPDGYGVPKGAAAYEPAGRGCEAACGGSSLGGCPETQPVPVACESSDLQCTYDRQAGCLCVRDENLRNCSWVNPDCVPILLDVPPPDDGDCAGDDCVSRVVLPTSVACTCGASGVWGCVWL
jgi:hypothetical protein